MNLETIYKLVIEHGIEKDPRGKENVCKILQREKEKYEKLSQEEKEDFDLEKLTNPYSDSRILYSTGKENIKTIMVGIDIEISELLLANTLIKNGLKIDAVITHHPEGRALANLYEVMNIHSDVLNKFGVPINIAESIMEPRIKEISRKLLPVNHNRAIDAARLLNIPFMSIHTPADNCVSDYLQKLFDKEEKNIDNLEGIIKILKSIPEYKKAQKNSRGPVIVVGDKTKKPGKIFVDMTGGTEGAIDAIEKLSIAGVGTIIGMHMSEEHIKTAEKNHINVIIAGHISSDTLGLNLMLDYIEKQTEQLKVVECSGFERIRR